MRQSYLIIEGARQNNLKNIFLRIPHNKLTVITGVSGAGKSSLAMDTIFAEAHTRYVESLSTYSRLFLERIDRPDLDNIKNIRPAILLEQRNPVRTSRSTVGTVTEIYDYLRLLFPKIGTIYCPRCNVPVHSETPDSVADKLLIGKHRGKEAVITFPIEGQTSDGLLKKGFIRIMIGNKIYHLEEDKIPQKIQSAKVIVDRLQIKPTERHRLVEALETAFKEGDGTAWVEEKRFVTKLQCPECGKRFKEPEPYMFSFNHALGACPKCKGFGNLLQYDIYKVIPNPKLSLEQGAIEPWTKPSYTWWYESLSGINRKIPFYKLSPEEKNYIKETLDDFFNELERKRYKLHVRVFLSRYKSQFTCPECKGSRLRPEGLQVKIKGKDIYQITQMTVKDALSFFNKIESKIAQDIIETIRKKLVFLHKVGLDYLTLDRQTRTLSGGESQRVNLAQQLGMGLTGTLYILDEPTIGLHARDIKNLAGILKNLAQHGNTLIVVEHDTQIIKSADYIIKLGPGAGENGGRVIYCGYAKDFKEELPQIEIPKRRKASKFLKLTGARLHNLKNIDVTLPLRNFICITGVSGAGKSSLIYETLYQILAREFHEPFQKPGPYKEIHGIKNIRGIRLIDQEPISRSPRSNPATYIGVFSDIRHIMAYTKMAKALGFSAGDFSFNTGSGRCPACQGEGYQKMEMYFLADVYYKCEECDGKRYKKEILDIRYKGKNIDEILQMTVDEAIVFFEEGLPRLDLLKEVGLGYLRLGQPLSTLSGGEAQRLKIAAELTASEWARDFIYILDEPTTGLHLEDIKTLLKVLNKLVDEENTVIVVEHNLDVIKCADYVIDLGPEGGEKGGYIVVCGTPEEVSQCNNSYTGRFLRRNRGQATPTRGSG